MYKILFLVGKPLSGKSSIASGLSKFDEFQEILSYTDREKRYEEENSHIFKSFSEIQSILENNPKIVASTNISGYRYFSLEKSFSEDVINVYVVDKQGVIDTINYFQDKAVYMTCYIDRDDENNSMNLSDIDKKRLSRNINVPYHLCCDFRINNNFTSLDSVVNLVKTLCLFNGGFFRKYSNYSNIVIESIQEKEEGFKNKIKLYENLLNETKKEYERFKQDV